MLFIGPVLLMLYGKRPYDMREFESENKKQKLYKNENKMTKILNKSKFNDKQD